jgi:uncharacterized cupredoxin-like copper-binding protein
MKKKLFIGTALLLMALVAGLALAACAGAAATPAPLVVNLKAEDIKYDTMSITAKVGQPVTVNVQNAGALEHSFVIDALSVKLEHVQAGQTATVTFTPIAAGTYESYCDVPGHKDAGMKGTLTVTP